MAAAASLSNAAARLELGRVLDERILPPEILFPSARHNHEVKCLAVGHFDISVQHSEISLRARYGPGLPGDLREVNADDMEERLTNIEFGSILVAAARMLFGSAFVEYSPSGIDTLRPFEWA